MGESDVRADTTALLAVWRGWGGRCPSPAAPRRTGAVCCPAELHDPATIPKYELPLVIPPVMPPTPTSGLPGETPSDLDYYEIAIRQFEQQILPTGMPKTTVWGHGSVNHPETFNYPSFTVEATTERAVRVKWINGLVDASGDFLPHLLPVGTTLHWANPPGGDSGRDSHAVFDATPGPYTGPVPMVTHLHGGHNSEESDGCAEAWYLPAARNIPTGCAVVGSYYDTFRTKFEERWHQRWEPGTAVFQYENDQPPSTLWFHDHVLGMTRVNVYAGPAGFYLLRGGPGDVPEGVLPGPAPRLGDAAGTRYYEIPIVVQDRSFKHDDFAVLPVQPPLLRRLRWAVHPRQRHLADLQPGDLRQHDRRQRQGVARPRSRAAPLPLQVDERLQLRGS